MLSPLILTYQTDLWLLVLFLWKDCWFVWFKILFNYCYDSYWFCLCISVDWALRLFPLRSPGTWWRVNWRWLSSTSTSSPWTLRSLWRESRLSSWMPTSESPTWAQSRGFTLLILTSVKRHWDRCWQFPLSNEFQTLQSDSASLKTIWHETGLILSDSFKIPRDPKHFSSFIHLPVTVLTAVQEPPCCSSSCPTDKRSSTPETSGPIPPWRPTPSCSDAGCRRSTWTPRECPTAPCYLVAVARSIVAVTPTGF